MSDIPFQPKSPGEWQKYSNSQVVTSIPLRKEQKSEQNTLIERDIYLDESKIEKPAARLLYLYADVFAFTKSEITISPAPYSEIQIVARVLTADKPVHLKLAPQGAGFQLWIFGYILDQPISVSVGNQAPLLLGLGLGKEYVGVKLNVHPDKINPEYQKAYNPVVDEDLQASLDTQLRVALALFWRNTSIAISICSYVAALTVNPALYSQINAQAVSLGQQLSVQAMTGPDMGYAPVLKISEYLPTVRDGLDAVTAFQDQYDRFQDNEANVEMQIAAWNAMLEHAQTQLSRGVNLSKVAWAKYQDACVVVARCQEEVNADNRNLSATKEAFNKGLVAWYAKTYLTAAFETLSAIIKFTNAPGILSLGFESSIGAALADIKGAIDEVIKAEKQPDHTGKIIKSSTLETLGDCMQALESLYPKTATLTAAIKELESDPKAKIPAIGEVTGSSGGDADSRAIITLTAWDKWSLECDQQLEYAISQSVAGASGYRLALRKQAVNGKTLAQAQAEAVKAGQEYVQAAMEVMACYQDISSLKELLKKYKGEKDKYALAKAKFFSRVLAIRTSVVMQMQKLVWAYRYWALADSTVVLDSQKPIVEFRNDLFTLEREIESADEKYATDFQPFNWTVPSKDLPANYGPLMVQGLKGENHSASFTLAPSTDPTDKESFASVFKDGSHFRLDGLETFLQGVVPRPEAVHNGVVQVDIDILTTGVYADIQGGKIFHFASLARQVRLSYDITAAGEVGETHVHAIFPTQQHAEPTPFTQWTIKLRNPEQLDLAGLSGVDLHWKGHARFVKKTSQKQE
ncbi:hypothetical protein ASPWEDRAFT_45752 [Aspergillus wentii DTO 134E9]|uniref:Uncharacterized protein n=1 Tax=Aspergillus wentii DTO 134E9 TaxID=1073089 RepID=A0A1L9R5P0_ASPWE|nr:uncharacterized protein ASPWEDRAFT_45752 [Aspergillus wentii DTO 134E9]KAI9925304.1 hypothetical protein MW887_006231 [Aspergillus wentii]OJJ30198.1 hypothetical protein ASPWEDRAFT_45752 [Aspergillus wentii DTO 134E9]